MKKILAFIVFLAVGVFLVVDPVQALRITLKRVVFEGPKRAEVLTIINGSDKPETYRLGWRQFKMTSDKSLVALPEGDIPPEAQAVMDMVRFSPYRFTVQPKSSQQVRMMVRIPADLPDGEYRSHFWVRPEADVDRLQKEAEERVKSSGARGGASLTMLAGATMPVIVRKGNLQATASIANMSATESGGFVTVGFSLLREGDKSLYGDIDYTCNPGIGAYNLRTTKGIAVYTELNQRNFNLRIEKRPDQPRCNTLAITFTQIDGFDGEKGQILAEGIVQVNQ